MVFVMLIRSTTQYSPDPPVYCGFGFGFDFGLLFVIRISFFDSPSEADLGCATAAVVGIHAELNNAAA